MKKFSVVLLALAAALAISPSMWADPITGTIGIAGGQDSWSASGTSVTFNSLTGRVVDDSGNLSVIPAGAVNGSLATLNVSSITFATPDELILTTSQGIATFTITGAVTITQPANTGTINTGGTGEYLDVSGSGILTLTGYDATVATFSFDSTDSSANYGVTGSSTWGIDITSTDTPAVPEPGTLSLFGTGLLGLAGMLRRKFMQAR